jgi:hypothetical protein
MPDKTANNSALTETQAEIKSEFEKVGQFKYVMNSALGWLSAFFCAVCSALFGISEFSRHTATRHAHSVGHDADAFWDRVVRIRFTYHFLDCRLC